MGGVSASQQPVPPEPSSHTGTPADRGPGPAHVIRINRLTLVAVALLACGASFPAFGWPAALGWVLLLPLAALYWVLRVQTTVSATGLHTRDVFGSRTLRWAEVKGVRFPKRGFARADLTGGTEITLPAVSFDRLRELAAASQGHIPDPYDQAPG